MWPDTVEVVTTDDGLKALKQMGAVVGKVAQQRILAALRDLPNKGRPESTKSADWVDALVERGKAVSDELIEVFRNELHTTFADLGLNPQEVLTRLGDLFAERVTPSGVHEDESDDPPRTASDEETAKEGEHLLVDVQTPQASEESSEKEKKKKSGKKKKKKKK